MSEIEYTPGPWWIDSDKKNSSDASIGSTNRTSGHPIWIGRVYGEGVLSGDLSKRDANAALIAAAPDLLVALTGLVKEISRKKMDVRKDYSLMVELAEATKAIMKATGQES